MRKAALLGILFVMRGVAAFAGPAWQHVSATLDYTPHGAQPGLQYTLLASDNCGNCHASTAGNDAQYFPYNTWAGSMMANAARDPLFWAALDVANNDQPGVGDYCLRCHTPQGWYGGHVVKTSPTTPAIDGSNGCRLAGNYVSSDNYVAGTTPAVVNDYSGETCHFCHRLMSPGPLGQSAYTENANAWLDDSDCGSNGPCRRGPYDYLPGTTTVSPPPHPWQYSAYHTQSAQCGLCHNVTSPDTGAGALKTLVDASGTDTGIPFPIERTFREWQQSDFADVIFRDGLGDTRYTPAVAHGQTCQDCHMPNSSDPNAAACTLAASGSRSGDLATHTLAGGNTWVPSILAGEYGSALNRSTAFAQTIAAAQQMLAGAAQLNLTPGAYAAPNGASDGSIALAVRVTNLSGHKLPSGYSEGRRVWLDVQVRDAANVLVAESGAYDASTGILDADPQARVYEVLQGVWQSSTCVTASGGKPQFHFVLNNCIAKDNRIPPLGFSGGADAETRPVGAGYGSGARLANYDDAPYTFVLPAGSTPPYQVSATLYYQTSSKEYIEFLHDQATTNAFAAENTLCSGATGRPFSVGPQDRSRGEFVYQLWNNAPGDAQPGYGRSPPQAAANVATATVGN